MIFEIQGSGKEPYKVDTEKLTCTCPNFRFRCSREASTSPNRLCKHLQQVFEEHPELAPTWMNARLPDEVGMTPDSDGKTRYSRIFFDVYVYDLKAVFSHFSTQIKKYEFCGSYRRLADRCSDLDVLLVLNEGFTADELFDYLQNVMGYELIKNIGRGSKKAAYLIDGMVHVDFKVIPEESWPFATLHFTGSKENNIKMRQKALSLGYSLSEYGLRRKDEEQVQQFGCKTEEDIFRFLQMQYLEPWDR